MRGFVRQRADRTKNLVGFLVGEVRYAVNILRVREIITPLPLVVLPQAPDVVVGVADHRGEIVPIMDLRRRFGLPPAPSSRKTKWIIVKMGQRSAGLAVDAITEVFGASETEQRHVPELGFADSAHGVTAVYVYNRSLVFVIDVDHVAAPTRAIDMRLAHAAMMEGVPT